MSLAKVFGWTAISVLIKLGAGLAVIKLFAVTFGPAGFGLAGNFRQLMTVMGVLCGAGIFNGIIKYVAQYHQQPERLRAVLGTCATIISGTSVFFALVFLLGAKPVSIALFGDDSYQTVIRLLAVIQMGMAITNFFLAILKGYCDTYGTALTLIIGSLVGVGLFYCCLQSGTYTAALTGLALFQVAVLLPAGFIFLYRKVIPLNYLKLGWDTLLAGQLSKFTVMMLATSCTLPLTYMMMRRLLARYYDWHDVGLWQGMSTISDAWLQLVTASFTVYLLPTLSRMENKADIVREIMKALYFILPLLMAGGVVLWLLRDLVIELLFSSQFTEMSSLFGWQLVGDVLKTGCWIFGYLVIARASLYFYILNEVAQCLLLAGFAYWLIPLKGASGAVQAYMATYIIYFILCSYAFFIYRRKM